ncbi:UvrD-helicase domain-containing protein [Bradyrhizobium septentrionale]|uniref:DNA 3'-5' helicase n=1 Tax=Bradyrhizobium septentrionale TaxID=1404411 RepID=A0ABZ2PGI3_9BRAD
MSRQYASWSIVQLEEEFERAQDGGDRAAVERVVSELGFRTTAKARSLLQAAERFLGAAEKPRSEPGGVAKPSPNAKAGPAPRPRPAGNGKPSRKPTVEQQHAIDQFQRGGSVKINAYAGTGKTSTLEFLAHSTSRRGQYIAFNRSIVRDAEEKFPNTVNCATSHSLAFKATPSAYRNNTEKMTGKVNANQLAEMLNLKRWSVDGRHVLQPRSQGYLILDTLRRYMQSADAELTALHVPRHGSLLAAPEATMRAVTEFALHGAKHVWSRMSSASDAMPLGHDGYLKLWALSNPKIAADFILLDEAQDTNPVVLDVLRKQPAQMVYVGDKYQQIYEWRGAVNAMEKIATQGETYLTTSFRFGPAIAEWASKLLLLLGEMRPLKGNAAVKSRVGSVEPRTILARTNATTIAAIIECLDEGKKPHLVGGTDELMDMLRGVQDLKEGRQSTVPDFFGFNKWEEIVEFAKGGEGDHLMSFVNLVESRGERQLMWALNRTVDEERSDLTISTAHKAKGREWSTVRLMDDFLRSQPGKQPSGPDPAEVRLFYVALTRAKEAVEVPPTVLSLVR